MVRVSITVVKYHDQKPLEEKGFISISSLQSVHHPEDSGQELKVGIWSQVLKQRPQRSTDYWIVPYGLLSLLPYMTRNSLHMGGITSSELSSPMPIINRGNAPTDLPVGKLIEESSQLRVLPK